MVADGVAALLGPASAVSGDTSHVPRSAGLYGVHAGGARSELGLPETDSTLLYIGKAERSLAARDLTTHFTTGRTGQSTLRRSLAALLREQLDLHAVPRNPAVPGHFTSFGLSSDGDERLTRWMVDHLALTTWAPPAGAETLRDLERAVIDRLQPPLNLTGVRARSDVVVKGRAALADEARRWARSQ